MRHLGAALGRELASIPAVASLVVSRPRLDARSAKPADARPQHRRADDVVPPPLVEAWNGDVVTDHARIRARDREGLA